MAHRFVAFDLGAESGRSLVGTLSGGKLSLAETHRFANPNGRLNGTLHWNLIGQWEELKTGLRNSARTGKIDGIGVDTWGVDFGLLDGQGQLLGNPVCYRDSRTDGMMERAFNKVSRDSIFKTTGIQFMQLNTLFQLFAMAQQKSEILKAAKTLLFMPDLFHYLFTGVQKCEATIASTSQMIDPRTGQWATAMLKKLGIRSDILLKPVTAGTIIGKLSKAVQAECGVGAIPVIAPGSHDTASAVASVPVTDESDDWCYISSGTWSLMGVESKKPIINDKSSAYNYTNERGVGNSIRFLKNIMGLWLVQECRRQFLKDGKDFNYAQLTIMAGQSQPFVSLVDPDHNPFLSPGQMPAKIVDFCKKTGQKAPADEGAMVRTCLESLAMTYRKTVEGLEDILGKRINTIHIVGGGTQNELLSQMTADATGRKVIAGPIEATAIGNILVQAMAIGAVKSLREARKIVARSFPVKTYVPRDTGAWDVAYDRYRNLKVKK